MKNYDKIILLFLFILSCSRLNNFSGDLNKLKLILDDCDLKDYKIENLFKNPFFNYLAKNPKKFNHHNIINSNKRINEKINKDLEKEINDIQNLIKTKKDYLVYLSNDDNNIKKNIKEDILELENKVKDLKYEIYLKKKLNKNITTKFPNLPIKVDNNIKQEKNIFTLTNKTIGLFSDTHKSATPFLKALKLFFDKNKYNFYNIHGIMNKLIDCKISKIKKILDKNTLSKNDFELLQKHKFSLDDVINNLGKMYLPFIADININDKKLSNKNLNEYCKLICFTIDNTIGFSFYNVLSRILNKHILNKYSNETDKVAEEVSNIMKDLEGFIIPIGREEYQPSELTKILVRNSLGLIDENDYYKDHSEDSIFKK